MRTRLKVLTAILGALLLLATACVPGLNASNYVLKSDLPEVVPPTFCPKEGALLKLRAYNIATATFHEAIRELVQNEPGAANRFEAMILDSLEFDGRLSEVFTLALEKELPTDYFTALLAERRINALVDVLRPCPDSPFLPSDPIETLRPQTGARGIGEPYLIPITFDLSGLNS